MRYCGGEDCGGRTWSKGSEGLYVSLGCWGGLKADECDCLSLSVLPSIVRVGGEYQSTRQVHVRSTYVKERQSRIDRSSPMTPQTTTIKAVARASYS